MHNNTIDYTRLTSCLSAIFRTNFSRDNHNKQSNEEELLRSVYHIGYIILRTYRQWAFDMRRTLFLDRITNLC